MNAIMPNTQTSHKMTKIKALVCTTRKPIIINIIGGPGTGKSVMAAALFVELKVEKYNIEYVQEYAKYLVLLKNFETLSNQHYVAMKQYTLFENMSEGSDIIITDGSLLHALYYNRNVEHFSDIEKTEKYIISKYNEFENINIFLNRNPDIEYDTHGRIQTKEEAFAIDKKMKKILNDKNIPFTEFLSDLNLRKEITRFIDQEIKRIEEN